MSVVRAQVGLIQPSITLIWTSLEGHKSRLTSLPLALSIPSFPALLDTEEHSETHTNPTAKGSRFSEAQTKEKQDWIDVRSEFLECKITRVTRDGPAAPQV